MMLRLVSLLLFTASALAQEAQYGVDCSFPIHHAAFPSKECTHKFADDRVQFYEDFMQGCRDYYGRKGKACDETEKDRIMMSLNQPQSMVNYTSTGFRKIRAPKAVMDLLYSHWEANKDSKEQEVWATGNLCKSSRTCDCADRCSLSLCSPLYFACDDRRQSLGLADLHGVSRELATAWRRLGSQTKDMGCRPRDD